MNNIFKHISNLKAFSMIIDLHISKAKIFPQLTNQTTGQLQLLQHQADELGNLLLTNMAIGDNIATIIGETRDLLIFNNVDVFDSDEDAFAHMEKSTDLTNVMYAKGIVAGFRAIDFKLPTPIELHEGLGFRVLTNEEEKAFMQSDHPLNEQIKEVQEEYTQKNVRLHKFNIYVNDEGDYTFSHIGNPYDVERVNQEKINEIDNPQPKYDAFTEALNQMFGITDYEA